ncbi:MAG: hypothetical protein E2O39_02010 [Planctomycetota bacterium]|nr:MAG: hypothetical protein E2O39_02010 [Planctomycetota bacterium]
MDRIKLDEEARAILRQILERQAYRQLMAANIRGHGLRFLPDLDDKLCFTSELDFSLRVMREIEHLYGMLDGDDLYRAVRERMDRIPYPESRLDLAVCLALTERAECVASGSYESCVCDEFATIAKTLVAADRSVSAREEELFIDFCADPTNLPLAQQFWNRWMTVAVVSFGRPGTRGDSRAVALGLRSKHSAEVVREFLDGVEPLRTKCGLKMPPMEELGVELPDDLRARFSNASTT